MDLCIEGKLAVVTGAARSIGCEIALAVARESGHAAVRERMGRAEGPTWSTPRCRRLAQATRAAWGGSVGTCLNGGSGGFGALAGGERLAKDAGCCA